LHFADWVLNASIDRLLLEILDVACKCPELAEAAIDALLPSPFPKAAIQKSRMRRLRCHERAASSRTSCVLFEGVAAAGQRGIRLQGLEVRTKWVNQEAKS
jgi:hypothetical protein